MTETHIIDGKVFNINKIKNWGDLVPFLILRTLSRSTRLNGTDVYNINSKYRHNILSTGSVFRYSHEGSLVWGTGCIDEGVIGEAPKKIYAVRGPLTRKNLMDRGIECPEVYGDPALLFPIFYNPEIYQTHKYGFIPHYIDYEKPENRAVISKLSQLGVKIINVCSGEYRFVDELLSVEHVLSSSLHGLILADAYGLPNAKVNLSNDLIGGQFKFEDYFMSVSRPNDLGYQLTLDTSIKDLAELSYNTEVDIDFGKLLDSGPWNFPENKHLFY